MFPEFNTVVIIDSLKSESTSENLKLDIHHATVENPVKINLSRVYTLDDFLTALYEAAEDLTIIPMVHISAHGSKDGIKLIDGFAKWDEVLPALQKINTRLKNKLIVVASFCLGVHILRDVEDYERSPFSFLLAPESEIDYGLLERLMTAFYQGLLKENSFRDGIEAMFIENGNTPLPFVGVTSTQLVHSYCTALIGRINSGRARQILFEMYNKEHSEKMPYKSKDQIMTVEDRVDFYDSIWNNYVVKFLMLDLPGTEANEEVIPYLSFKDYYYRSNHVK